MYTDTNIRQEPAYRHIASGMEFHLGMLAALLTVCIWSGWLVAMRYSGGSVLTTFDLAMMRYALPAVLLFPFVWRSRHALLETRKRYLIGIILGAGLPFFYLSAEGLKHAPVVHAGLLIPGTFPVFVTLIAMLFYREPPNRRRLCGLLMILLGVLALMMPSLLQNNTDILKGDLLLLGASFCWAVFTVSMRVAGLPPLAAAGLLCMGSSLILLLQGFSQGFNSGILLASDHELLLQLVMQVLGAGLLAGFCYGYAINRLGAENTSAIGSLTPVVAGIAALPLLGESLSNAAILGMLCIGLGVLIASGIRPRQPTH